MDADLPSLGLGPITDVSTHVQRDARPSVTFPTAVRHCCVTDTKLHCLVFVLDRSHS